MVYVEVAESAQIGAAVDMERLEQELTAGHFQELMKRKNKQSVMESGMAELLLQYSILRREPKLTVVEPMGWKQLTWQRGSEGKPEIPELAPIEFNLSHGDGLIACAWGDGCVGVDIQAVGHCRESVARHFFLPTEQQWLAKADDPSRMFYRIWTRREALVKYLGISLWAELPDIHWQGDFQGSSEDMWIEDIYQGEEWLCRSYSLIGYRDAEQGKDAPYALALCTKEHWDGRIGSFREL